VVLYILPNAKSQPKLCYPRGMRALAVSLITAAFSILALHALDAQQSSGAVDLSIDLPAGASAVLEAQGDGVQIYTCTDMHDAFKWVLKAPDAKLLDKSGKRIGTHFAGPAWRLADGSQVEGKLIASKPAPDVHSVAWLLLGAKSGTGRFANVRLIRRTETHGGVAPESGCRNLSDAGKTVRIPYTATYTFYTER
jgi:Protein of unknown function (DUF3455)